MGKLRRLFLFFFFFSGFSALIYEVVWTRQLSLIFGTTAYAIASILAIFFTGLALGSWFLGKAADKNKNPLLLYAFLEFGIGFYAILTPWIFKFLPTYFGFNLRTFLFSFLGLIIPTIFIGGTLPVLARFWVNHEERVGGEIGLLYFVNTLGATLGTFLSAFFLIAALGVKETIWLAAFVNLVIGLAMIYLAREWKLSDEEKPRKTRDELIENQSISIKSDQAIIFLAFFLTGFSALALEVLWTRILILFFGGSTYALATVLVVFLLGIALGSAFISKLIVVRKINGFWLWFGWAAVLLGVFVIISLPLFQRLPFWLLNILKNSKGSFGTVIFWEFLLSALVMFAPTFLMGIIFPLGVQLWNRDFSSLAKSTGKLYAVNTLGGVFGSLAAGFLLIPTIGVQKGIWLAATIYLLVGALLLLKIKRIPRFLIAFFAFLTILIGWFLPSWNKHFLISGPFANWRFFVSDSQNQAEKRMESSQLLYYKEGIEATVAVKKSGEQVFLRINGKTDAATGLDMDTQILSGQLPMLLHPNPQEVLVVGLGSGITLGSVGEHPLNSVEVVEIEQAVVEASSYFAFANHDALNDKRLKVIVGDGRNYLLSTKKKYDVITSEPSNVWISGNSKLFTKEYFQLARGRLKEGGLFAHWIQLYNLNTEDLKIAIKTFQSVFPYTSVWDNLSSYDLLLIGSLKPQNYDLSLLEEKFKEQKIKDDLARIFIDNPTQLLSYLVLDSQGVTKWTENSKENTDNHPLLEFSAPKSLFQATISQNLEGLKDWRPNLFPEDRLWQKYYQARNKITLGKMFFTRGENQKAIVQFEEALKIDSGSRWLKLQLGKEN